MSACRFDYAPAPQKRPALACTVHPRCMMKILLWREGLLHELVSKGLITGQAQRDAEGRA